MLQIERLSNYMTVSLKESYLQGTFLKFGPLKMLLTPCEQLNKLSCVGYTADVNIEVLARGTAGFSGKKYVVYVSTVHSSVSVRP